MGEILHFQFYIYKGLDCPKCLLFAKWLKQTRLNYKVTQQTLGFHVVINTGCFCSWIIQGNRVSPKTIKFRLNLWSFLGGHPVLCWYSHSDHTHAAAESPGQEAGAGLGVCSLVVLTDVAGEVHGSITQISGNHQLRGHWGRSLVHWSNIWRRRNFSFNKQDFNCDQQFSNICYFSWFFSEI